MRDPGFPREARRRPELDLLVGPLEAASMEADDSPSDVATLEDVEATDRAGVPIRREDG
jgi:hypothetical protein